MKPDDSRSLIALVQKHKLDVSYWPSYGDWNVRDKNGFCLVATIDNCKTWTAAVRKAKRVIEKGKK